MIINNILNNRDFRFKILSLFNWVPDEPWLKLLYRIKNGYWMDFNNPRTFNEKLQWLKIHGFRPEYTQMVDKYAVKDYVSAKIGKEYVIPTLGVWDSPDDIDWEILPNKFVLKTTHGGGGNGVVICTDKTTFDKDSAIKKLRNSIQTTGIPYREHPYDNVPPRIIAEEMLENEQGKPSDLADYKFYCFNGEPVYCQVIRDRSTKETIDFYDMEWNHMPFVGLNPECKNGVTPVPCPSNLDDMKRVCCVLAKDIPFARIDLYEVKEKEYFGEITFFPAGGFGTFEPSEWNIKLGDLLSLEGVSGGGIVRIEGDTATIAEPDLRDYKFFCFNGKVRFFKVDFGRFTEHRANYYSPDCRLLPYGEVACPPDPDATIQMPSNLDKMIELAEKLSAGIPFLRVDLYNVNGRIYFGELTFYPAGGLSRWTDDKWDREIGDFLTLPEF